MVPAHLPLRTRGASRCATAWRSIVRYAGTVCPGRGTIAAAVLVLLAALVAGYPAARADDWQHRDQGRHPQRDCHCPRRRRPPRRVVVLHGATISADLTARWSGFARRSRAWFRRRLPGRHLQAVERCAAAIGFRAAMTWASCGALNEEAGRRAASPTRPHLHRRHLQRRHDDLAHAVRGARAVCRRRHRDRQHAGRSRCVLPADKADAGRSCSTARPIRWYPTRAAASA